MLQAARAVAANTPVQLAAARAKRNAGARALPGGPGEHRRSRRRPEPARAGGSAGSARARRRLARAARRSRRRRATSRRFSISCASRREFAGHVVDPRRPPSSHHGPGRGHRRRADGACSRSAGCASTSSPTSNLPVIYVAQPYGGMSPAQMEGYHRLLLRVPLPLHQRHRERRVEVDPEHRPAEADVPSRHRHGRGAGADDRLRQSRARVHAAGHGRRRSSCASTPARCRSAISCSRATRRSLGEIQDLALNRVRPQFATLPGLTSPPPFGGSQRTIVIRVDPDRLRSYGMSPDEVIRAVTAGNVIMPSGSVNIGDETRISPMNSVVVEHQRSARAADSHGRRADGVHSRRRLGQRQHRHSDGVRAGERPAGRLHSGHEAARTRRR